MPETTNRLTPKQRLRSGYRRRPARVGTFSYVGHGVNYEALLELVRHRSRWTPTCHVWEGAKTKDGYPCVYIDGKPHRLWRLLAGLEKNDHTNRVLSSCGNRLCVNLEHLGVYELRDGRDS